MANVSFHGNVVRPELKDLGGKSACTFTVAEGHRRKDKQSGNYEDSGTTWYRVVYFGNGLLTPEALFAAINQPKTMVLVTGRQETRDYTDKDGNPGSSLEVTADYAAPLQKGGQQAPQGGGYGQQQGYGQQADPWQGQPQQGGYPQQGQGGYGAPQQGGPQGYVGNPGF